MVEITMSEGQQVSKGDLLVRLALPELDCQIVRAERRRDLLDVRLARSVADTEERAARRILQRQRAAVSEELAGL
ncbi:MAG: hypothetical protein AAGG57_08920 [Pseudomonadota bacterium]